MDSDYILPEGQLVFANLISQREEVSLFVRNEKIKKKVLLYSSYPANGLTRFLKQVAKDFLPPVLPIYVDVNSKEINPLLKSFFKQLDEYLQNTDKGLKENIGEILSFLSKIYSDFEGPGANTLEKFFEFFSGTIRSISFEKFVQTINKLEDSIKIVFIIDNVQSDSEIVLDFINATFLEEFENIIFILGYQKINHLRYTKFLNEIFDNNINLIQKELPKPSVNLIHEIFTVNNSMISRSLLEKIIKLYKYNMHEIFLYFRKKKVNNKKKLSNTAKSILGYLRAADQSLSIDVIKELLFVDPTIYIPETENWISDEIKNIDGYVLNSNNNEIKLVNNSIINLKFSELTYYRENLYQYYYNLFESGNNSIKNLSILFHLSEFLAKDKKSFFAEKMLIKSLMLGELKLAKNYFNEIEKKEMLIFDEFIFYSAFLLTTKKYKKALKVLNSPEQKSWESKTIYRLLKVIALNRCRFHAESIKLTEKLINEGNLSFEQLSILISYYVVALIHCEKKESAYEISMRYKLKLAEARNYGYFLRNIANTCNQPNEAIEYCNEAINWFSSRKGDYGIDSYGINTTRSNLGVYFAMIKDIHSALTLFLFSFRYLSSIGFLHVEEVLVNIGIVYIFIGKIDEAKNYLKKCINFSQENVPKYYAFQLLSLIYAIEEKYDKSEKYLIEGFIRVKKINIEPHKQRFIFNAILILSYSQLKHTETWTQLKRLKNTYVYDKVKSKQIMNYTKSGKLTKDKLLELFIPPYLFYASQEPIFVLDELGSP